MTERAPKITNAPGLTWRPCAEGWEARWRPRADLVKRGCQLMITKLWKGLSPSETQRQMISERCIDLQGRMLIWGRGGLPDVVMYDGTVGTLVACYQSDPDSGFQTIRFKTRENYGSLLRRVQKDCGEDKIANLDARRLKRLHEGWMQSGTAMSHGLVGILRTLATFGATFLKCRDCRELKMTLSDMRFPMPKPRQQILTAEHAIAVRKMAHEKNHHSMALAQAFQFECTFRQKDVIGEWVPLSEPGISSVCTGTDKWIRGLRWEAVSDNLILRHVTSKRQKEVEVDLKLAPMVIEELSSEHPDLIVVNEITKKATVNRGLLPTSGPIIVDERSKQPWRAYEFRRKWRQIAKLAGVPNAVYNMDSRAGAITEALQSGAHLQSVRKAATHSTEDMTQKYSRGEAEEIAEVMTLRAAKRNKSGTK